MYEDRVMFVVLASAILVIAAKDMLHQDMSSRSCGTWQDQYSKLHYRILKGEAPQRYLISVPPFTGLADKLVGIPGELMWAMLTNRAFQYIPRNGFPSWNEVFEVPRINITGPNDLPHEILDGPRRIDFNHYLDRNGYEGSRYEFHYNFNEYFPVCLRNNDSANTVILAQSDLNKFPPTYYNTRTLIVESNRGMTYRFFENPYHGDTLRSWGLTPENSFGCIMNYLFHIKKNGCDETCQSIMRKMKNAEASNVTIIGIQVRIGDNIMDGEDKTTLDRAAAHLRCAQDLADEILERSGCRSIFYMISDSIALLQAAKDHFGDRLLADTNTRPMNTAHCAHCHTDEHKLRLIHHTTNQVFLFARAHYHVVTTNSGFGMMGAWMSDRPIHGRVFRVTGNNPVCRGGESNFRDVVSDPRELAIGWSGI